LGPVAAGKMVHQALFRSASREAATTRFESARLARMVRERSRKLRQRVPATCYFQVASRLDSAEGTQPCKYWIRPRYSPPQ